MIVLGLLIALWLIAVWLTVLALLAVALVWLAMLVWRVAWAVVGFLLRLVIALVFGPDRRPA